MLLNRRTNVLFDEIDYTTLVRISKKEGKTIGELVRQAVRKTYKTRKKLTDNEKAFRIIKKVTRGLDFSGINYKELINNGRKN